MKAEKLFYTRLSSPDTQQLIIVAEFLNLNLELNQINKKYDTVNLLTPQGVLNKTNSILRYLANGSLLAGSTFNERNLINTWYEFFNTQLLPVLNEVYAQVSKQKPANQAKYTYCVVEISKNLKILDDSLKLKTFFIGNKMTIFDITLACYLDTLLRLIITQSERKKLTNLFRWYQYVRSIPIFTRHLGQIQLCGKDSFKIDFPVQNNFSNQQDNGKKEAQKSEIRQQKLQQKPQFKKQQKTQTKTQQKPQKKTQILQNKLEELKNSIKTSDDQVGTLNKFLQTFEKDKFSIWKIEYKKSQQQGKDLENTKTLADQNLKKIPNIPKVAFGTWGVYGQQGNYKNQGVMIWKGKEVHALWKKHPSFQKFAFTKLSAQQDKLMIVDYLTESKVIQGLTLQSTQRII